MTVAEDAMNSFTVHEIIPAEAVANDKGTIIVTASATVDDGDAYVIGSWQYGGTDVLTDSAITTCSSAIIALTKIYDVQNPGSYTGNSTNVPGFSYNLLLAVQ